MGREQGLGDAWEGQRRFVRASEPLGFSAPVKKLLKLLYSGSENLKILLGF